MSEIDIFKAFQLGTQWLLHRLLHGNEECSIPRQFLE